MKVINNRATKNFWESILTGDFSRRTAMWMAIITSTIWATSWILIKIGLREMPAIPFVAIRYFLAFLILIPWLSRKSTRRVVFELSAKDWILLAGLGVVSYTIGFGGLYLALSYLPNTTVSLIMNFSTLFVAIAGHFLLKEKLTSWLFAGMAFTIIGALVFFLPIDFSSLSIIGLIFSGITLFGSVAASVYSRKILRSGTYPVIVVTGISMGIGSTVLVVSSSAWQWIGQISLQTWIILLVLAVINTAFAFSIWNISLQKLTAFESNIINSTMLVQVALLSWIILGEVLTLKMVTGMALVMLGVVLVNFQSGN